MSDEVKSKIDYYTNWFFKGLWIVITYFLMDVHSDIKDIDKNLQGLKLDYAGNKAEIKYRVQAAEDNIKFIRREAEIRSSYSNNENGDSNLEGDH